MKLNDAEIGAEINEAHHAACLAAETAVDQALLCGTLLCRQKTRVGHGKWISWVTEHCDFSHDTANVYMRAHRAKTRGLVFSSLSELLRRERTTVVRKPNYIDAPTPPNNLPIDLDAEQWRQARCTFLVLRWLAKDLAKREIDAVATLRALTEEEKQQLRAHVRVVHRLMAEFSHGFQCLRFGRELQPLEQASMEDFRNAKWSAVPAAAEETAELLNS